MACRLVALSLIAVVLTAQPSNAQALASERDRREALTHYRSGQELLSTERWERAVEAFRKALDLEPLLADAHYGMGQAFMGLQRFASAVRSYEACIETTRTLHSVRNRYRVEGDRQLDDDTREMKDTMRRMQAQGRTAQARQIEERIRDLERERSSLGEAFQAPASVLLALGSAHFRNGDRAEAERCWSEAVKVNSQLGEAWNNLAVVYMGSGRKKQAEDAVKNAERAGFRVHPRLKDDIRAMKS